MVNGAYEDQIEKIKELDKQSASDFVLKNMKAYNDAVKELNKTKTYNVNCIVPHWEEKTSAKYRVTRN